MSFLPDNYQPPSDVGGYMKFVNGENRFRMLGGFKDTPPGCVHGSVGWMTNDDGSRKPERIKPGGPVDNSRYDEKAKVFWACRVWSYANECVQILDITQKTVLNELVSLANDPDWGDLTSFDLTVHRSGEGKETRYSVTPKPKAELTDVIKMADADTPVDLFALFSGDDPYETGGDPTAPVNF